MIELVEFTEAQVDGYDDEKVYIPKKSFYVNPDQVTAISDHLIITNSFRIPVMETKEEIRRKLSFPPDAVAVEKPYFKNL